MNLIERARTHIRSMSQHQYNEWSETGGAVSNEWFHFLNVIGVAFFAISGTLMGYEKKVDGIGIAVLASVTALGGGTLRDILLNQPVFWVEDADYLISTYLSIIITIILIRHFSRISNYYLLLVDALGLALFNIVGIEKSLIEGTSMVVAITMGITTGVFGSLIRDVICREIPMVVRGELYATACIVGGLIYALLLYAGAPYLWCILASLSATIFLRLGAIHWGWQPRLYRRKR